MDKEEHIAHMTKLAVASARHIDAARVNAREALEALCRAAAAGDADAPQAVCEINAHIAALSKAHTTGIEAAIAAGCDPKAFFGGK